MQKPAYTPCAPVRKSLLQPRPGQPNAGSGSLQAPTGHMERLQQEAGPQPPPRGILLPVLSRFSEGKWPLIRACFRGRGRTRSTRKPRFSLLVAATQPDGTASPHPVGRGPQCTQTSPQPTPQVPRRGHSPDRGPLLWTNPERSCLVLQLFDLWLGWGDGRGVAGRGDRKRTAQ